MNKRSGDDEDGKADGGSNDIRPPVHERTSASAAEPPAGAPAALSVLSRIGWTRTNVFYAAPPWVDSTLSPHMPTVQLGSKPVWRFAYLVPAGDVFFLLMEGVTLDRIGIACLRLLRARQSPSEGTGLLTKNPESAPRH
jgi:hypothetical protein